MVRTRSEIREAHVQASSPQLYLSHPPPPPPPFPVLSHMLTRKAPCQPIYHLSTNTHTLTHVRTYVRTHTHTHTHTHTQSLTHSLTFHVRIWVHNGMRSAIVQPHKQTQKMVPTSQHAMFSFHQLHIARLPAEVTSLVHRWNHLSYKQQITQYWYHVPAPKHIAV